jgi:hypothetical protein
MKKIFLILTLLTVVNIFCEAQSGLDVIMVSPTQYNAILKRDSIIQVNKVKPKNIKPYVRNYHGSKFSNNILIPTENNILKPISYPFYKPTNNQHISTSFDMPLIQSSRIILVDTVSKAAKIDSMKNAKLIEIEIFKNSKKIEHQAKADKLQDFKNEKTIKIEKFKNSKKIERQKKEAKLTKLKNNTAKYNEKLKNKQLKKKKKINQKIQKIQKRKKTISRN